MAYTNSSWKVSPIDRLRAALDLPEPTDEDLQAKAKTLLVSSGLYPLQNRWRVGRKVGRTIYAQIGPEPSDDDVLIGVMDTRALAEEAVAAHNATLR
jgi:hypothetical protein